MQTLGHLLPRLYLGQRNKTELIAVNVHLIMRSYGVKRRAGKDGESSNTPQKVLKEVLLLLTSNSIIESTLS